MSRPQTRSVARFTLRKQDVSLQTLPVAVYWRRLCMNYMSEHHVGGAQRNEREVENKGGWAVHAHRGECWLHQSFKMKSLRYPTALSASLTPRQERLLFLAGGSRWPLHTCAGCFPACPVSSRFPPVSSAGLTCGCAAFVTPQLFPFACKVHGCR